MDRNKEIDHLAEALREIKEPYKPLQVLYSTIKPNVLDPDHVQLVLGLTDPKSDFITHMATKGLDPYVVETLVNDFQDDMKEGGGGIVFDDSANKWYSVYRKILRRASNSNDPAAPRLFNDGPYNVNVRSDFEY